MKSNDLHGDPDRRSLRQFVYLIPVLGFFPALWALYRQDGSDRDRATCRLAVTLALGWLFGNLLLQSGANITETSTLPVLITSSVLTTSYFIVNFGLMVRLWKNQPLWLPGVSRIAEGVLGRHLS
ncbi:hypothetical protein [Lyngbya sp. CCY1209]|jgi:hypothetical protein|uniref:hypothetical protein n=1 Tax=Lyngbya sp. CCY1209 TaxID=2886103 RepID=UPI002D2123CE|nr:hypothetical protein [Lyngbya sp. CCY1209]MEB3882377.1 hypothetical protein [Lyngbya sp. CCY1209]